MDPKEKAVWLIDRGYINDVPLKKVEEAVEAADTRTNHEHEAPVDANTLIVYEYINFMTGIDKIARQITDSRWMPDYIVGVVRGGAVPAVYLSHKLKVPVKMLRWNTRDETTWENESACYTHTAGGTHGGDAAQIPLDVNCNDKKILVVDDIVDGGTTIQELLADWNKASNGQLKLDSIRIAAMVYNTAQDVNVSYYDIEIDRTVDKRWVVFPWEA